MNDEAICSACGGLGCLLCGDKGGQPLGMQNGTDAKRNLFIQQMEEHERKATEKYDIPIVGFMHAFLASAMRTKLNLYDINNVDQQRDCQCHEPHG